MRLRLLLILIQLLAACAPAVEAAAPPPNMRVGLSYAAQSQRAALLKCIPASAAEQIEIDLVLGDGVASEDYDLLIRLGEPSPMPDFAAQVGQNQIVALINTDNPLHELSRAQLADLFSGRVSDWESLGGNLGEVQLWIGLAGDETRNLFRQAVLQGSEFSGAARLAATPELMMAAIAADSNAIGLLPASLVPEGLRGLPTGISVPVLALAQDALEGPLREIVACMQGG